MTSKEIGLIKKYHVERVDGKPLKDGAIVLEFGDPNARAGIMAFAHRLYEEEYYSLSEDLQYTLRSYDDYKFLWDLYFEGSPS